MLKLEYTIIVNYILDYPGVVPGISFFYGFPDGGRETADIQQRLEYFFA